MSECERAGGLRQQRVYQGPDERCYLQPPHVETAHWAGNTAVSTHVPLCRLLLMFLTSREKAREKESELEKDYVRQAHWQLWHAMWYQLSRGLLVVTMKGILYIKLLYKLTGGDGVKKERESNFNRSRVT